MSALTVCHLSHHDGCIADFEYVAAQLGHTVQSYKYDDGYNISRERADDSWERWRSRFTCAEVVLVSDTAPLSRIILQHLDDFRGRLVIWVCNRFDYADQASNDCGFPDPDYYTLFRQATAHPRVRIVPYTRFEAHYASGFGVELGEHVIKPIGLRLTSATSSRVPAHVDKTATLFVPPYHNDTVLMSVADRLAALGLPAYCGRYGGAEELRDFKAVVHIPYSWSTLAFFENLQNGIPMFVPSSRLLNRYARTPNFFWPQAHMLRRLKAISEWYAPEHRFLVYFRSWRDLRRKLRTLDLERVRREMRQFGRRHAQLTLERWSRLLDPVDAAG